MHRTWEQHTARHKMLAESWSSESVGSNRPQLRVIGVTADLKSSVPSPLHRLPADSDSRVDLGDNELLIDLWSSLGRHFDKYFSFMRRRRLATSTVVFHRPESRVVSRLT